MVRSMCRKGCRGRMGGTGEKKLHVKKKGNDYNSSPRKCMKGRPSYREGGHGNAVFGPGGSEITALQRKSINLETDLGHCVSLGGEKIQLGKGGNDWQVKRRRDGGRRKKIVVGHIIRQLDKRSPALLRWVRAVTAQIEHKKKEEVRVGRGGRGLIWWPGGKKGNQFQTRKPF